MAQQTVHSLFVADITKDQGDSGVAPLWRQQLSAGDGQDRLTSIGQFHRNRAASARRRNKLTERLVRFDRFQDAITALPQYLVGLPAGDPFGSRTEECNAATAIERDNPFDYGFQQVVDPGFLLP